MTASEQIAERIAGLTDWRGPLLARLRRLILDADPNLIEEWKWSSPVWSRGGLVCSVGVFKDHLKLNFFQGAALPDPRGLLGAGLDAKASRAIDLRRDAEIDEPALTELIRAAVAHNLAHAGR